MHPNRSIKRKSTCRVRGEHGKHHMAYVSERIKYSKLYINLFIHSFGFFAYLCERVLKKKATLEYCVVCRRDTSHIILCYVKFTLMDTDLATATVNHWRQHKCDRQRYCLFTSVLSLQSSTHCKQTCVLLTKCYIVWTCSSKYTQIKEKERKNRAKKRAGNECGRKKNKTKKMQSKNTQRKRKAAKKNAKNLRYTCVYTNVFSMHYLKCWTCDDSISLRQYIEYFVEHGSFQNWKSNISAVRNQQFCLQNQFEMVSLTV